MRPACAVRALLALFVVAVAMPAAREARCDTPKERLENQPIDPSSWTDHDGQPIPAPKERHPGHLGNLVHESFVVPLSRTFDIPDKILYLLQPFGVNKLPEAVNVNLFDEVPNSTWFTNRNHVRSLSPDAVRRGAFTGVRPTPPYTIKSAKRGGLNPGFNIKDAAGKRWVVKLDSPGHPQASSGAAVVSSRIVWAAGYNISHDEAFTFRRDELLIDPEVERGKNGEKPLHAKDLELLLERGAKSEDGRYYAAASLFLPGKLIGPLSFRGKRTDDPNDRFFHKNRRELRGLYVVYSWINNWDVKDGQSLDSYGPDSVGGHVTHYLLDVNGSLGAAREGAKPLRYGYEERLDAEWILKRVVTLGFVTEPWRRAHQETGIPSVGNFESQVFDPGRWDPLQYVEPFRRVTLADAYWGAKIVASFSDAQIAAAIDAAGYEDPRARAFLLQTLIERRDKVARHWFRQVAPLDFFYVQNDELRFHDLAVDRGLTEGRSYRIEVEGGGGTRRVLEASSQDPRIPLGDLGGTKARVGLTISIHGSGARPVHVDLERKGGNWFVARVRHA